MIQKGRHQFDHNAKGESNGKSVLTELEVREIRELSIRGYSQHKLAEEFQIGRTTVQLIIQRKTWRHVT
jgi:orotate phosphoribosyltransferase-like protein